LSEAILKKPFISIVIASAAGGDFLFHCLNSLVDQYKKNGAEIIVVDRRGEEMVEKIQSDFPNIRLVPTSPEDRLSVPELRCLGIQQSRAEVVAVIEEHCIAAPDWIQSILTEIQPGDAAVGGPVVDSKYQRIQDWVVYFSEYHNYLPPWQAGPRYLLNGVNIAYNRELLVKHLDLLSQGYWEVVLHPALSGDGVFRAIPGMKVYHRGPFEYRYYLEQRYLLSRVWGGTQRQNVNPIKRLGYLILAPIIPLLLLIRMANRVMKSKNYLSKFIFSLPLLVPVVIAYTVGEWTGYLVGKGDALQRVE